MSITNGLRRDIIICVGGTNSSTQGHSYVKDIYNSIPVSTIKLYVDGPEHTVTGSDWLSKRDQILNLLKLACKANNFADITSGGYGCTMAVSNEVRVSMFGHSRGCQVLINVASMLNIRTHFLGMFDAVNRTWDNIGDFSEVIYNVDNIYHARRDGKGGSRPEFGNTGLRSGDGGIYHEMSFYTTHGGIDGNMVEAFSTDEKITMTLKGMVLPFYTTYLGVKYEREDDSFAWSASKAAKGKAASAEARAYILKGAKTCGVPLP